MYIHRHYRYATGVQPAETDPNVSCSTPQTTRLPSRFSIAALSPSSTGRSLPSPCWIKSIARPFALGADEAFSASAELNSARMQEATSPRCRKPSFASDLLRQTPGELTTYSDVTHARLASGHFSGRLVIEQQARPDDGPRESGSAGKVQIGGELGATGELGSHRQLVGRGCQGEQEQKTDS